MCPFFLIENAVVMQRACCSRHLNFPSVEFTLVSVSRYSYSAVKVRRAVICPAVGSSVLDFTVRKMTCLLKHSTRLVCRAELIQPNRHSAQYERLRFGLASPTIVKSLNLKVLIVFGSLLRAEWLVKSSRWMEMRGLEPLTYALQRRRSPN